MTITIPTEEDLDFLAMNLRPEDRRELLESPFNTFGQDIVAVVHGAAQTPGECYVAKHKGVPFLLFGICRAMLGEHRVGFPWLFGTPAMVSFHKSICRMSKAMLNEWSKDLTMMTTYFDLRNETHIKWALRMGFRPVPSVINGFYQQMAR